MMRRTVNGLAGKGVQARGCRQGGAGKGVQARGCRQGAELLVLPSAARPCLYRWSRKRKLYVQQLQRWKRTS